MSNVTETCNRYNSYLINNQTFFKISTAYEGIPQNFAINIGAYIALILLFIFLRKKAWNYGKVAWINKPISLVAASMVRVSRQEDEGDSKLVIEDKHIARGKTMTFFENIKKFIPLFIKMNDEQLRQRCGSDAVIYCQFQRYLILFVAVMMTFSLTVILPLNLFGGLIENSSDFSTLTIANVKPGNPALWAHFSIAFILMLLAFFLSNHFLRNVDIESLAEVSSTIMIKNVPPQRCDELIIKKHFQEAFPSIHVRRVQVTHKVDKLIEVYAQKVYVEEALEFCYREVERGGEPVMVIPCPYGRVLSCSDCCHRGRCTPVDGVEYYTEEMLRLSTAFVEEKTRVVNSHKLPIVFVTFASVNEARLVRREYIYQNYCCVTQSQSGKVSSVSKELQSSQWNVAFAPEAEDILWQNLHKQGIKWWIPLVLANVVVAIVVIILSTPSMVLNLINQFKIPQKLEELNSPIVAQVVPSLVLVLVNSLMPTLVYWSDELSGHWTKTIQNMAVMNKLYVVLVTTVLILPSLGLNSIPALVKWLFPDSLNVAPSTFKWECIFMPDGGALFCNYLISASFIGTALELLRLGELFLFACQMSYSKSRAEDQSIAQKILWEFPFGLGYAWTLALFSMVSAYAVIVPIITPFGLVYLVLKHLVDRYNLIHVNIPSVVHNSVHTNAAQLMQVGLALTQATVTIYVTLRLGSTAPLSICCYVAFFVGIILVFGRTTVRWVLSMACVKYAVLLDPPKDGTDKDGTTYQATPKYEEEGFVLVDEFKKSTFVPRQMTIEESANVEDFLRRKSLAAPPLVIKDLPLAALNGDPIPEY